MDPGVERVQRACCVAGSASEVARSVIEGAAAGVRGHRGRGPEIFGVY